MAGGHPPCFFLWQGTLQGLQSYLLHSARKRKTDKGAPALFLDGWDHKEISLPPPALAQTSWLFQAPCNLGAGHKLIRLPQS